MHWFAVLFNVVSRNIHHNMHFKYRIRIFDIFIWLKKKKKTTHEEPRVKFSIIFEKPKKNCIAIKPN